jgi:hypothetical protein
MPNIIVGYIISFWPQQTDYSLLCLHDSDITNVISASSVIRLAFVFDEDDPILFLESSSSYSSELLSKHSA